MFFFSPIHQRADSKQGDNVQYCMVKIVTGNSDGRQHQRKHPGITIIGL